MCIINISDKEIYEIAESIVEAFDLDTLIEIAIDGQIDYINSLNDDELIQYLKDIGREELIP